MEGSFMSASPPSPTTDHRPATIIPEDAVSIAVLDALFKRAFFKTKTDEEGHIYITAGLEFPIWVRGDAERKLITFFTFMHRDLNEHPPFTVSVVWAAPSSAGRKGDDVRGWFGAPTYVDFRAYAYAGASPAP